MLSAVYELSTVVPHERPGARYSEDEWRTYCDGYYYALVFALRVMDLAGARWATQKRVTRDERRRNKSA